MSSVEIFAEIGSCHDGAERRMRRLADVALENRAVPKLQFWSSARRMAARRHAPQYEAIYERYAVPEAWLAGLRRWLDVCEWKPPAAKPPLACSVYLPEDVDTVAQYADVLKVSSFEANDRVLLEAVQPHLRAGKRVVVSLGLGADATVAAGILARRPGAWCTPALRNRLAFLVCTSAYPAPLPSLRLGRLWPLASRGADADFGFGFSDHSPADETVTGALAVAAGACILERHVRLRDTKPDNPDRPHSSAPDRFSEYCRLARAAADAVGPRTPESGLETQEIPEEAPMRAFAVWRKS